MHGAAPWEIAGDNRDCQQNGGADKTSCRVICGHAVKHQDQEEDPKLDHDHAWKLQLHDRLAHLSSRGNQVVVPNSGHDIPDEAPEAVVDAVRNILQQTQVGIAEQRHSL